MGEMSAQTKDKSGPINTLSVKSNKPSLRISIPSSSFPLKNPCKDGVAAMSPSLLRDDMASSLADNVAIAGDSLMKKARARVVRFSNSCKSTPVEFTVPTSPAPPAGNWYNSSNQSEETSPKGSDTLDDSVALLLDYYLLLDANAAQSSPSDYSPQAELDETSENWDGSHSGLYGTDGILERLYDSYLDEDMSMRAEG